MSEEQHAEAGGIGAKLVASCWNVMVMMSYTVCSNKNTIIKNQLVNILILN